MICMPSDLTPKEAGWIGRWERDFSIYPWPPRSYSSDFKILSSFSRNQVPLTAHSAPYAPDPANPTERIAVHARPTRQVGSALVPFLPRTPSTHTYSTSIHSYIFATAFWQCLVSSVIASVSSLYLEPLFYVVRNSIIRPFNSGLSSQSRRVLAQYIRADSSLQRERQVNHQSAFASIVIHPVRNHKHVSMGESRPCPTTQHPLCQ